MKKFIILILAFMFLFPIKINAQRGCCSHHGGVAGCNSDGRQICKDGTLSPTCTCTPVVQYVYGCTDSDAKNYNENATRDNGSCEYYVYGCTDVLAINYNEQAEKDDGSCEYKEEIEEIKNDNLNINKSKEDDSDELLNILDNQNQKEEDTGTGGILIFALIASALGTYLYKKKKNKK